MTRVYEDINVLRLMFGGTLTFREDGKTVTLTAGDYYIQKAGLRQEGLPPVGDPALYYLY